MRNAARQSGFTLVEALCAGVVLAIGATMLSVGASTAIRSLQTARDNQRAAEILDEVLTRVDLIGPATLSLEGPTEGIIAEAYHWSADINPRLEGNLYDVTVTIQWQTATGVRQVEGYTLLNDASGSRSAALRWEDL